VLGDDLRRDLETAFGFGIHARALGLGAILKGADGALIATASRLVAPLTAPRKQGVPPAARTTRR